MADKVKRVCDWSEVKQGEVFVIHKQTREFQRLGVYQPDGTALTIQGNYVQVYGGRNILRAPAVMDNPPKQEVDVIEIGDHKLYKAFANRYLTKPNEYTGADPEIFVVRGVKPSLLPAYKFLPTQKEAKGVRRRMPQNNYDYPNTDQQSYAYRDGFAAEYFVYPVACHSYVVDYVRDGLMRVLKAAKEFDKTARLTIKNTFTIPTITMNAAKDEDIAFGCKPSINAYGDEPQAPDDPRKFKLRFTGGHVHLGCANLDKAKAEEMVKAMDIMAAIPAVAMFEHLDSPVRRQYYGRAGEYRMPKHGLEYRVLSNAWLCAPAITHLLFNLVRVGGKIGYAGRTKELGLSEEKVREIINFCDVRAARKFVEENSKFYASLLSADGAHTTEKGWLKVTQEGVESLYEDVDAIDKNWHFTGTKWRTHSEGEKCDWGKMCRSLTN